MSIDETLEIALKQMVINATSNDEYNAGIILFNINTIEKNFYFDNLKDILNKFENLSFPDQDILNIIFEDKVEYISQIYNFQTNIPIYQFEHINFYSKEFLEDYNKAINNPKLIHFAGEEKPWTKPNLLFYEKFWKEAAIQHILMKLSALQLHRFRSLHIRM